MTTKTLVALVGTKYRGPEMVALLASLPQGESLTLKREPDNQHDRNAIQVWAQGHLIGYVKSSQNKDLALAMDALLAEDSGFAATGFVGKLAIDGGRQPMVEIDT
jgi:hypothetical protein